MERDWRADEEAIDEARMDRYLDDPEPEPIRPADVLSDEELAEYYRQRRCRRG